MTARTFKNQRGFSLVEVMIATSMMVAAGVSMMSLSQLANQDSVQLRATRVALAARSHIEAALKNPAAWRQTVALNTSFACTSLPGGCPEATTNGGFYDFVLYGVEVGDKITYDSTDTSTRYSIQGGRCPAETANPDPQCPIKYVARWRPLCQTYPCQNPMLDVRVSLVLEFGANAPSINAQKYDYSSVRGLDDGSVRSACQILDGTYNVATGRCYPKNAGRTCESLGKPHQIVVGVGSDGSITCAPLYTGRCPPDHVMKGISATGEAQCVPRVQPPNCPTPCIGAWGSCSATCNGGTQTYGIITPATNGGPACIIPAPGDTRACNTNPCPVNCVGAWSACSQACGGGSTTFSVTTPAAYGGANCTSNHGDSAPCNTQACAVPVNCGGTWSACNQVTGTQTFTVTQVPQNGGAACPSPLTRSCPVNCRGEWGDCEGSPFAFKTYSWTTVPRNGGSACRYANGQTDYVACRPRFCVATWWGGKDWRDRPIAPGNCTSVPAAASLTGPIGSVTSSPYNPGYKTVCCSN